MTCQVTAPLIGRSHHRWLSSLAFLILTVFAHNTSSSTSLKSTAHQTNNGNSSSFVQSLSNMPMKKCDFSSECGILGICKYGTCECGMGYDWDGTTCKAKPCKTNRECYTLYDNSKCSSNSLCVCDENYDVDLGSQTCKINYMSHLKEPYFYGPFICLVAVIILLLAFWYYCCRKQKHTTIIFHKGNLPAAFTSNTVATDHIPTISQTQDIPSHPPPSYTPFETQVIYTNQAFQLQSNGQLNGQIGNGHLVNGQIIDGHSSLNYARCASHQSINTSEMYRTMRSDSQPYQQTSPSEPHFETNYFFEQTSIPPPPPPPPPSYTPLSSKVPIL